MSWLSADNKSLYFVQQSYSEDTLFISKAGHLQQGSMSLNSRNLENIASVTEAVAGIKFELRKSNLRSHIHAGRHQWGKQ